MYVITKVRWFHSRHLLLANGHMVLHVLNVITAYHRLTFKVHLHLGVSSGDAMKAMEEIIGKLPSMGLQGFDYEWTGLSLEERESGAQAPFLYALSLLIVFLCLAALYESWSIPFSVLLVVPLGVIGAIVLTYLGMIIKGDPNLSNNIYFQGSDYCGNWSFCKKCDLDC